MYEKIVPDIGVLIEGVLSKKLQEALSAEEIIIHEAIVAFLEEGAEENKVSCVLGIHELERLKELEKQHHFRLRFCGSRPRDASYLEINYLIRQLAFDEGAVLLTQDVLQEKLAKAKGVSVIRIEPEKKPLRLEGFFDDETMSVHLREGVEPQAKRGQPGNWRFARIGSYALSREDIEGIATEIMESAKARHDGFVEIERPGSAIIQLGTYRIVITRPPFSDGWEITAVRPVRKMSLEDYNLSEKLKKRIEEQAEGVLIAGSPGMGKSTFAAALAEYYSSKNKIVKTVEAPRDLVLSEGITQYAISHGDAQEIHDILLLSRPDYTFFDEMRNTEDFKLFADLRLAGIGFVGVVHATKAVDAIQRFVGRIELGVIPQIVDTVIFIKNGQVGKVLSLQMVVKVPEGMTEADLARPVVVVSDFESRKPEYELYSYGEETVVVPVTGTQKNSPVSELAKRQIEQEMKKYCDSLRVEMTGDNRCRVYVPEHRIASIIGRQGQTISEIEKRLGIGIDVEELAPIAAASQGTGKGIPYSVKIGKNVTFIVDSAYTDKNVSVVVNGDYLLTAKVSKKAQIKIKKNNKIARIIIDAINTGETIELFG